MLMLEALSRVEEFRESDMEEQQIYGNSRAVWDRCNVHGLFSMQPDMQGLQQQLQALTNGAPLQYEAGALPLLQHDLQHCFVFNLARSLS